MLRYISPLGELAAVANIFCLHTSNNLCSKILYVVTGVRSVSHKYSKPNILNLFLMLNIHGSFSKHRSFKQDINIQLSVAFSINQYLIILNFLVTINGKRQSSQ